MRANCYKFIINALINSLKATVLIRRNQALKLIFINFECLVSYFINWMNEAIDLISHSTSKINQTTPEIKPANIFKTSDCKKIIFDMMQFLQNNGFRLILSLQMIQPRVLFNKKSPRHGVGTGLGPSTASLVV